MGSSLQHSEHLPHSLSFVIAAAFQSVPHQVLRCNSSGSFATFAAILLASSFVSNFAADRPLRFEKIRVLRLTQIPTQELSAPHYVDDRGHIFFDHDALL